MEPLLKYFPLVKIDEAAHMVWGIVTSETPDSDKEICDYDAAKSAIKAWSDETLAKTTAAGQDPSLGNMRVMHQLRVGGKAIKVEYHDEQKQVWVGSEPADNDVWHLLKGGFLTAHSIGGHYAWKRPEGEYQRYGPTVGEISYVDKGSNPDASFAYVKADGTTELRKFAKPGPEEEKLLKKIRDAQISNLSQEDINRITASLGAQLDTELKKFAVRISESMAQLSTKGASDMKPEDIKKCAAALGISEDEFKKQYVAADDLAKAKSGLAALHAHIQAAIAHHEEMHHAHKAMASMHEKHATHLAKCMKGCTGVMGSDEKEAEKALKALVDDLKGAPTPAPAPAPAAAAEGTLTKAEVDKIVADAVKKAVDALPAPDPKGLQLRAVPRVSQDELTKANETGIPDAIPV